MFQQRDYPTEAVIQLLENTTLGTNGAMYRHLDTRTRISQADNPLFLSLERNNKVLGNITFCNRNNHWYIRYFAFQSSVQGAKDTKKKDNANSLLKRTLRTFFDEAFDQKGVQSMYAYIEPNNARSKWMSENFGFTKVGELVTQSFSRVHPKQSNRLERIDDWNILQERVVEQFEDYNYYLEDHCSKPPFWILRDDAGEIIAYAKTTRVNWEIVRLPGKFGGILTKVIPFIPVLRKIVQPKNHTFLAPEIVWVKEKNPHLLEELFSAILYEEQLNLMLWWIDRKDTFYTSIQQKAKWGPLNAIVGTPTVDVVARYGNGFNLDTSKPFFVTSFDLV